MPHPMLMRAARPDDLEAVVAIYNQVIAEGGYTADLEPYTSAERRAWFESHLDQRYGMGVGEIDGRVVGYFHLSPWRSGRAALAGVAEVSYYLVAERRGQTLGKQLLQAGIDMARHHEFDTLIAILLDANPRSVGLLTAFGFSTWGKLPDIAQLRTSRCGQVILGMKL